MNSKALTTERECSFEMIAAYLDGDLQPQEEIKLESHFGICRDCLAEFNLQKRMLSALDCAFDKGTEIELPENFAKIVATHAETNVRGLNSKKERLFALVFCIFLFLIAAVGLGDETKRVFSSVEKIGEQAIAVIGFIAHLAYSIAFGLTVVLRSVGNQPEFNSAIGLIFFIGVLIISTVLFTRLIYGQNRS